MANLIALYSSSAQSGKTEVSKILVSALGYHPVKFAAPLKDMVRGLLTSMGFAPGTVERMVEGDLKEEIIPGFDTVTPRKLMQTLGTDWGREAVATDLWSRVAMMKAKSLMEYGRDVVIDDLRFPNEYDAVRLAGGYTVRIIRPSTPVVGSSRYEGLLDNKEFDYTIRNDGTLEDLRGEVFDMVYETYQ